EKVRRFDASRVYDLQGKFRQNILYFLLGGPNNSEWSGSALLCSHSRMWPPIPGMHFTDFVAAQLRLADVPTAEPPDLSWLDAPLDAFTLPARYAILIPGCGPGRDYKRWPAASFARLARELQQKGMACIAVGTGPDADAIAAIRGATPDVIDLSNKT